MDIITAALALWASAGITRTIVMWPSFVLTTDVFNSLCYNILKLDEKQTDSLGFGKSVKYAIAFQALINILLAPLILIVIRGNFFKEMPDKEVVLMASGLFEKVILKDPRFAPILDAEMRTFKEDPESYMRVDKE